MDTVHPVLVLSTLVGAWACSPIGYREVHMDEMAHMAPIIAYGRVVHRFPDHIYPESYTAEVEVKCTYKGGPIPEKINISLAGNVPGMCGNKNFTVGLEYIAFLRQDGNSFTHMYDGTREATAAMDELMTFCDLHLDYPTNATNQTTCPSKHFNAVGCHRYIPPTRPKPPALTKKLQDLEGSGEDVGDSLTGLMSIMTSTDTETPPVENTSTSTDTETPPVENTSTSTDDATDEIIVGIVTMEPTKVAEAGSHNTGTIVSLSAVCVFMTTLCSLFS